MVCHGLIQIRGSAIGYHQGQEAVLVSKIHMDIISLVSTKPLTRGPELAVHQHPDINLGVIQRLGIVQEIHDPRISRKRGDTNAGQLAANGIQIHRQTDIAVQKKKAGIGKLFGGLLKGLLNTFGQIGTENKREESSG